MAGIGFELRKLYRKQGIVQNLQAYAYSTMTSIGPMILCLILVIFQQWMMENNGVSYLQKELFIATIAYCFVFTIIITSGLSIIVTRFVANQIYEKKYNEIINAYYGSIMLIIPFSALIAIAFLWNVEEGLFYKFVSYMFFLELTIIWMQNVFMSALKDYKRIFRGFGIAVVLSMAFAFLLYKVTVLSPEIVALLSMDIGFACTIILSSFHFEYVFPRNEQKNYFAFLSIIKKYPTIFFIGLFVYSSVYIHTLVYWFFSDMQTIVSGQYYLTLFYDVPVFFAYISVLPSLIFFVVILETDFYERFLNYYQNVTEGGTVGSLKIAKEKMQRTLIYRIGFLAEIQLLFTTLSIALGTVLLPKIGFTMEQLDIYITLCFSYFFFILMFVLIHILMYFDDQKGIFILSSTFLVICSIFTFITMKINIHGFGMFIASFIGLCLVICRLYYILKNIDYYTYCSQPLITLQSQNPKARKLAKKSVILSVILTSVLLTACSDNKTDVSEVAAENKELPSVKTDSQSDKLTIDDKRIYEQDDDASITTFYMTVLPNLNNQSLDWYGLNRNVERYSEEKLDIILAEGEPNGAGIISGMFGANEDVANAKISLRGNTARNDAQKSYKINLLDSAGTWKNQTTINLNKHTRDGSRLRNKLSFDLMEKIPNISSLRTQFVHLYVKDLTSGKTTFEDYGLYTQIEQPNKKFLRNHLFDPNGYLYKVSFFEFDRYPDQIRSHTDPSYDKKQFETILEIKGREDHDKLIQMLNDVNSLDIPINEVIDKFFDEDNLLTWVASNILMDNMDTDANNFYLYSPLNSDKWLILPWDYDDGWNLGRKTKNMRPYQMGISNYWNNTLLQRYFKQQENINKLTAKLEELYSKYINEQKVTEILDKYKAIPAQYISKNPDIQYLPIKISDYEKEIQEIIQTPKQSLELYYKDLQKPKPFFINTEFEYQGNQMQISWDESYDFQGDALYYSATLAKDPQMQNVVAKVENIRETTFNTPKLNPGVYYLQVTVQDDNENTQISFDQFIDGDNNYYGIVQIEVH